MFTKTDGQDIFFNKNLHGFFLDDIIIYSLTFEQHLYHIEQVMIRLQGAQLTAKPLKLCVQYLGYTINKHGITTTEENIEQLRIIPYQRLSEATLA